MSLRIFLERNRFNLIYTYMIAGAVDFAIDLESANAEVELVTRVRSRGGRVAETHEAPAVLFASEWVGLSETPGVDHRVGVAHRRRSTSEHRSERERLNVRVERRRRGECVG